VKKFLAEWSGREVGVGISKNLFGKVKYRPI
jgi:hypothetical protein